MSASPISGLRLVATMPPALHFNGVAFEIARNQVDILRQLGASVYGFDTSPFYKNDLITLQSQIDDVRTFKPHAVLSLPSAGYAVEIVMDDGEAPRNVFLDILELPTILYWDHALVHASRYVTPSWPASPFYSARGVKQSLQSLLTHPLAFHYFPDTAHASEFHRLGIGTLDQNWGVDFGSVGHQLVEYGQTEGDNINPAHRVGFVGNLYLSATQDIRYDDDALLAIRQAALAAVMADWNYPAYSAYLRTIGSLDPHLRSKLRLDADQSFYWRFLYDELCSVANGEPRFRKLLACGHPVTYFGGFADLRSRNAALNAGWILADKYLPYGSSLAAAYHQIRVTIDVANAPFINGFSSKILGCFAAGGFMLTTRKPDMAAALGPVVDAIGFSNAEELSRKVDYYLTHDRQRLEIAREIKEIVRRNFTTSELFARTVPMALDRIRTRIATGGLAPKRARVTAADALGGLGTHLFDVSLDALQFDEGALGALTERGLDIMTSPQQWAYSLRSSALADGAFTGAAVIRVELQVSSGRVGIGVTQRDNVSNFLVEFSANPSASVRGVDIPIDLGAIGALIIRNQSGSGASEATIRSIKVFRPDVL
ncbi:Glycosyl transferases group 1 [Rhizobiales bacterium GAS191]|nr:Glycosyl transferases group 1 [Rhizobiales bacterium GAS191]